MEEKRGTSKVVILMICICIGFVCMIILVLFKLVLTVAGDIELNPGPYEILKSVQGSHVWGNCWASLCM